MNWLCIVLLLLFAASSCGAESLREFLRAGGIPGTAFTEAELGEAVEGVHDANGKIKYAVYLRRSSGEMLEGPPQVVRFNANTNKVLRKAISLDKDEVCCGSPDGFTFVGNFAILEFHYNPSAASVLVLDQKLNLVEILYGFDIHEIAPDQIVFIEDMMQAADIHPERLRFLNLRSGATREPFPPKDDSVRAAFERELGQRIPTQDACKQAVSGQCYADSFDEDVDFLGGDGAGSFAILAGRNASVSVRDQDDPVTIGEQSALYLYQKSKNGWLYCSQQIGNEESEALSRKHEAAYESVKSRCTPNKVVVPDMSTSEYSPFPSPARQTK